MPKNYKHSESKPMIAAEPAVAYQRMKPATIKNASPADWNPNHPVHATQEEWWDHIHQIEQGKFYTLEEFNQNFDKWEKEYLAGKLR